MRRARSVVKYFLLMLALMAPLVGWTLSQGVVWAVPCNKLPVNLDWQGPCTASYDLQMWCTNRSTKANCEGSYGIQDGEGPVWPRTCFQKQNKNWDHCIVDEAYNCMRKVVCKWTGLSCFVLTYVDPPAYFQEQRALSPSCVPAH